MNQVTRIPVPLPTLRRIGDATTQLISILRHLEEIKASVAEPEARDALSDDLDQLLSVAKELTGVFESVADSADRS